MISRIIAVSIAGVFSLVVAILGIRNLRALRKEWREFYETGRREAQLLSELDAFKKRVVEWANQHPEGSAIDGPESQKIFGEALRIQMHMREAYPDYDGRDKMEFLLAIIKPDGAA